MSRDDANLTLRPAGLAWLWRCPGSKLFFLEKKNQKTFYYKVLRRSEHVCQVAKVFASFFKKKPSPCVARVRLNAGWYYSEAIMTAPLLRDWLLHHALPLWLRHGIDQTAGGFHEALAPDGYACDASFRRLRVVTRQIYVFAQAHRAGLAGADAAVTLGLEFLARHAALPEGGYAWRFNLRNEPTDTTRDLYDHAFVLLALAAGTAVVPAASLRPRALALLEFIQTAFAHPSGGYLESLPPTLPRRQNPHMHLLEALLAAHEAFGDAVFAQRAAALRRLFLDRLVDAPTGTLPEFFDDALRPETQDGVFDTEPGHHCEWVWLLHRAARLPGADARLETISARLMAFVDRHGVHRATGDLVDQVASDGRQSQLSARLWPQTERLKAEFLRRDTTQAGRARAVARLAAWLHPDGLWWERRDAAGAFIAGPAPASTLYHLTCAILTVAPAG
jgi:mannose-6-phosphate isomerase